MPYIKADKRPELDKEIENLIMAIFNSEVQRDGALNYTITKILTLSLLHDGVNYGNINKIVGVLECAN